MSELFALMPLITLSSVILVLLMVIAFARNLKLTAGVSAAGLVLTLISIVEVGVATETTQVTPLIVVDGFALLFAGMITLVALALTGIAYDYLARRGARQDEFFVLLLLATLGGITLVQADHFATLILGIELLGVSLYAMIAYPVRNVFSLEAATKYLILSGVSSAFILFGSALMLAVLGTLSFKEMSLVSDAPVDTWFLLAGGAMLLAGMSFKLSLVPFHMWTPDVYEGAPAPATAFLATVSKGAIFAVLLRFALSVDPYHYESVMNGLFWVAVLSMLGGNLLALLQTNIKRMLAYSSIAHIGYLLVAFIAVGAAGGRELGVEAASYFLIAYFVTTVGAFGVVSILSTDPHDNDADDISHYEGLFWRRPALAAFFTAMLLSLAGIPMTAGFVGKFYIFAAGVETQLWWLLAVLIVGSGMGLYYYLRTVFAMTRRVEGEVAPVTMPVTGGWVMVAITLALLVLGVYPAPVIELINQMIASAV